MFQRQQQQQPIQQLGNLAVKQEKSTALPEQIIRWRMDTMEEIRAFENMLLGRIISEDGKTYKEPEPGESLIICNKKGVAYARAFLVSTMNKITLQGNMTDEEVREILLYQADGMVEHIGQNYHEYGIEKSMRRTYITLLISQLRVALTRTIDDLERRHAVKQSSEHATTSQVQTLSDILPHHRNRWRKTYKGEKRCIGYYGD